MGPLAKLILWVLVASLVVAVCTYVTLWLQYWVLG